MQFLLHLHSQMFINLHFLNQTIGALKRKGLMVEMRFCLVLSFTAQFLAFVFLQQLPRPHLVIDVVPFVRQMGVFAECEMHLLVLAYRATQNLVVAIYSTLYHREEMRCFGEFRFGFERCRIGCCLVVHEGFALVIGSANVACEEELLFALLLLNEWLGIER